MVKTGMSEAQQSTTAYSRSKTPFWQIETQPGDQIALYDVARGTEVTFAALAELCDHYQTQMQTRRGLCLITARPTVETIAVYLAALRAGCPIILEDPKASAADDAPFSTFPILYRHDGLAPDIETNPDTPAFDIHEDLRLLLSTSGSTGAQKFVRLSGENLASNAIAIAEYLNLTAADRAPTSLPLSYSFGLSILNSHLAVGAALVLVDEPAISDRFWNTFDSTGCTSFAGVPQSYRLLMRGGQLDAPRPSLRYMTQAGGKLDAETVRQLAESSAAMGREFVVMYGQTEAAPRISYLPPDMAAAHPASIGRAIPGGRLSVQDEDGAQCYPGVEGELIYEGPNVMMGYAIETADLALGQGPDVLKTGDLGHVDEQGLFYITGRASRFLKLSGKRVSLDEIDGWMAKAGVDGVSVGEDDALGLIHTGTAPLAPEMAERLAVPVSFIRDIHVENLPFNQNGKIDLRAAKAIFETEVANTPEAQNNHSTEAAEMARELQAVWGEVLKLDNVPLDKSFYDLGGDSVSALGAALKLETMGVDAEVARGFFDGRTIADLTGVAAAPSSTRSETPEDPEATGGLTLAQAINAIHSTRGFLALLVVAVHWLPGVVGRLGWGEGLYDALTPLWRFGTPGFAMVFGIGVGALRLPQYLDQPERFRTSLAISLKLVLAGVALLALARGSTLLLHGNFGDSYTLSGLFYSAIFYYAVALAGLPLLMWLAALGPNRLLTILALAAGSLALHPIVFQLFADARPGGLGILELVKVAFTGKFGIFRMTGFVLCGMAIGWMFRQHHARRAIAGNVLLTGVIVATFGILALFQHTDRPLDSRFVDVDIWHLGIYVGAVLMLLALFASLAYGRGGWIANKVNGFAVTSGILALPIFIGHEIILEVKRLGDALGIPEIISLPVLVALFLGTLYLGYRRLTPFFGR